MTELFANVPAPFLAIAVVLIAVAAIQYARALR